MSKLKPTQLGTPYFVGLLSPHATPGVDTSPVGQALARQVAAAHDAAQRGSARRKLWDLSHGAACPVAGVCLNFPDLYKLARKAGLPVSGCSEYEVHIQVVSECRRRSDMAQRIQRELDGRYERQVKQASQTLKTTEDLARWWDSSCVGSDWAGVFWAVLTHPRCTPELEFIVLGQVHMLQHQVGMAARVDHSKLHEVLDENLRLGEELDLTQQRLQTARHTHAQELAKVQAECVQLRGEIIRAQTERDQALTQWQAFKACEPDLLERRQLSEENAHLLAHNRSLRRALDKVEMAQARTQGVAPPPCGAGACGHEPKSSSPLLESGPPLHLADLAVLCVGGRTGGIPVYRDVIEQKGARFMHHDGGDEERAAQLGSHLQAADVVICQVGCISHGAYWRVKEHCKRTGKPCLFVESTSRSALERALGQAMAADGVGQPVQPEVRC